MWGFHLNGWQRIGILLSVIRFIGFAGYMWFDWKRHAADFYSGQLGFCRTILNNDNESLQYIQKQEDRDKRQADNWASYEKCRSEAREFYSREAGERARWRDWAFDVLLLFGVEFVTIGFGWLVVWFGIVITRWIRRGSTKAV